MLERNFNKMRRNNKFKCFLFLIVGFFLYILFQCLLIELSYHLNKKCYSEPSREMIDNFYNEVNVLGEDFDQDNDMLALVDIQKTGVKSFEFHILNDLQIWSKEKNDWIHICMRELRNDNYNCIINRGLKPIFWNRYAIMSTNFHADYTQVSNFLMNVYANRITYLSNSPLNIGIFHLITFLRNPIHRYISEYEGIRKGKDKSLNHLNTCEDADIFKIRCSNLYNVSIEEFLSCEDNLANNRQVRMLANLNSLGCGVFKCLFKKANCSEKAKKISEIKLLESAKHTLNGLAFFGLTEYQNLSEYLFIQTFDEKKFKFSKKIPEIYETNAELLLKDEKINKHVKKIEEINHLDTRFYEFAKKIFFNRVKYFQYSVY